MDTSKQRFAVPWVASAANDQWSVRDWGSRDISQPNIRKEDALLIAAAPDLLSAVEAQHAAIDYLLAALIKADPTVRPTRFAHWVGIIDAHSAITKARGT